MMRALLPLLLLAAQPAAAEFRVTLANGEAARLELVNEADCATGPFEFMLDLRLAGRGARFAAEPAFRAEAGGERIAAAAPLGSDGRVLTLALADLPPGGSLVLTLPMEDGRGAPLRDLSGAVAAVVFRSERNDGEFGPEGAVRLAGFGCAG
ncbi:MAG: hypothetical protein ACE37J_03155 [Pikeienuella sp.]|uniref:hypothetical protein n=1 Tax=Pikeienuella sp. TaxID=2831957 RepID=UPI00391C2F0E